MRARKRALWRPNALPVRARPFRRLEPFLLVTRLDSTTGGKDLTGGERSSASSLPPDNECNGQTWLGSAPVVWPAARSARRHRLQPRLARSRLPAHRRSVGGG